MNNEINEQRFARYKTFIVVMVAIFSAIVLRLVWLQVVKGEEFRQEANNKSHTIVFKNAPRGEIYDINGKILATNRQSFNLIYTPTKESEKHFFETMSKVFDILDDNGEIQRKDFPLKINPFRLDFNVSSKSSRLWNERRFKKDRGYDDKISKKLFGNKKLSELNSEEKKRINDELDKITPEKIFYDLISKYSLYDLVKYDYIDKQKKTFQNIDGLSDAEIQRKIESKWRHLDKKIKIKLLTDKYDFKTILRYMIVKDKKRMQSYSGYKPVVIANDLKEKTAFIFEQLQAELPGISVIKQPVRYYPYNDLASCVIGYIKKISLYEKERYEEKGYDISRDYIGASGIEGRYESILRGSKGQESIEINKFGRKIKTLGELTPYPGENIKLTIDADLQRVAEKALDDTMKLRQKLGNKDEKGRVNQDGVDTSNATRGAAVVIDVNTGKILALASRPGYDPNMFAVPGRLNEREYRKFFLPDLDKFGKEYIKKRNLTEYPLYKEKEENELLKGNKEFNIEEYVLNKLFPIAKDIKGNTSIREDYYDIYPKPFYNYATMSLIPPGSTFKLLTAVAGLEEGVITKNTKILDRGYYNKRYKDYKGASWKWNEFRGSHGLQNVIEAIRDSNNYFFFEVADRLFVKGGGECKKGLDMLAKYAWKYGLGINPLSNKKPSTGIEIGENFGQVYNYLSGKNTLAILYMRQLYDFLGKSSASHWVGQYKSIDIVPSVNDSKDVYDLKKKISKLIISQMKADNVSPSEQYKYLRDNVEPVLKELIKTSSHLNSIGYTDSDIEKIIMAINYSVTDAKTEMKRGTNLYNASIGQGTNRFTPLQLANYVATLVNGGYRYKVHLVDGIYDQNGNIVKDYSKPVVLNKTGVSSSTIETVKKGMLAVTSSSKGGTAYKVFKDFPIANGGKTGSATFHNDQHSLGREAYGVYVGFAPYDKPEIAVCVVIFDGAHGGYVAPVAKAIYEEYFKDRILKINPNYKFMYHDED